jgi:predicted Zn-dependent protease
MPRRGPRRPETVPLKIRLAFGSMPLTRYLPRFAAAAVAAVMAFAWTAPALALSVARDTEIEEFLWSETRPVLKAAGIDPNAVKIYLVSDNVFNAFVSGGQNIFVTTGLLDQLDTPNQLLGVLAHETGHIAGGHLARSSDDMMNEAAPFLITMLAGLAAMLAGEGQAGMGIIMGAQQAMQRAVLGYSRVQESSADQAAISFLDRIQKSGRGMIETFEKLGQQELLVDRAQDPYARSHPMSSDRIASLTSRVEASPYKDNVDTPEEIAKYKLIQAKVRGFMNNPQATLRQYPGNDLSDPARYARSVAYYRMADFRSANQEIDALIAAHPENPYFWELKGQIVAEQRDFAGAAKAFEKSVKLKPKAALLQVNLGATLVALEDQAQMPRARDVLVAALQVDNTNAFAWLQLSFAYAALGQEGMAALSMAEQRFNVGNYPDAIRFAMRAREMLPKGSREAGRADDIVVIAESQTAKEGKRGRSGGGFTFTITGTPSDVHDHTR